MDFKKLIFVSGKGGTGKTTLALLLARHLSTQGKKVLFLELASRSSAQSLLELAQAPSYVPAPTPFGFHWGLLTGPDCLREYVGSLLKMEVLAKNFFENPFVDSLLNVAPGLNDLAILGKLTSHFRDHGPGFDFDHCIVDAPSTGSFSSLLSAPKTLGASVSRGPLHTQSQGINECLSHSQWVQYFFVGLFEELPVDELIETIESFKKDYGKQMSVIMNQRFPITEGKIEKPQWQNFVKQKKRTQDDQEERLKKMDIPIYNVEFFTESLSQKMNFKESEFLRPTSNH